MLKVFVVVFFTILSLEGITATACYGLKSGLLQLFMPLFPIVAYSFTLTLIIFPFHKIYKHSLNILILLISIFYITLILYYSFYGFLPGIGVYKLAGQLSDIKFSVIRLVLDNIFSLIIVFLILACSFLLGKVCNFFNNKINPHWKKIILLGLFFITVNEYISQFFIATSQDAMIRNKGMFDRFSVNTSGFGFTYIEKLKKYLSFEKVDITEEEYFALIDNISIDCFSKEQTDSYQWQQLPDIYIVQVESLPFILINKKHNGEYIVPNFSRLYRSAEYASPMVSVIAGGGSSDSEFSLTTGLLPLQDRAVFSEFAGTFYPANLFSMLKSKGYITSFFHGNHGNFWNMRKNYTAMGVDNIYFRDAYTNNHPVTKTGIDGVDDSDFFEQSYAKIQENRIINNKPVANLLITLTTHHPYNIGISYDFFADIKDDTMRKFFVSSYYSDKSFGEFYKKVKENNPNSIFIVYGDHYTLNPSTKEIASFLNVNLYKAYQKYTVPLIIDLPGDREKIISKYIPNQTNILPTLNNILGLKNTNKPYIGSSLLSESSCFYVQKTEGIFDGEKFTSHKDKVEQSKRLLLFQVFSSRN